MKKIILFAGIFAYILTACSDKNAFTLTGTFATGDMDGKIVYLKELDSNFRLSGTIDSVKVENGKFVFEGISKEIPVVQFVLIDESAMPATFIIEKGKIEMNFDSELKATVKGTPMNEQYQLFETEKANMFEKIFAANDKYTELKEAGNLTSEQFREFDKTSKQLFEELNIIVYNYIKPNIMTQVGQYFLGGSNSFYLNDSQLKELISLTTPDFRSIKAIQKWEKQIEAREATGVGKQFTDIKGFDLNGKEVSLSDYTGKEKVVLIDFWASWCGPCVRAIPDLVTIYQRYKNQGFEIVGISLDSDKESWARATGELKIPWPQFSNLKGWEEDGAIAYGVNGIPQIILIDKEGIIIERELRADALKFKLEELLGSK